MTFRNNAFRDGDEKDPNDLNDFGAPPPVATGSVVQLRVGDDSLIATFELEVHAPGGACELTSDVLRRGGSDGAGESSSTPAARVELGGCVRRAAHDPSPVSKLFGTSVTVDATLRDALGTVAPVGSAANEAANDATARLAAALTTVPGGNIPGGVLLWGAPGSGRSGVARCIARTLRDDKKTLAAVVYVSCGSMSHVSGQGDPRAAISAVKAAASAAARRAPAVVILDDLDAIAGAVAAAAARGGAGRTRPAADPARSSGGHRRRRRLSSRPPGRVVGHGDVARVSPRRRPRGRAAGPRVSSCVCRTPRTRAAPSLKRSRTRAGRPCRRRPTAPPPRGSKSEGARAAT